MRRLISDVVGADPTFEVVGTARDGEDALRKVRALDPDIVTLDVVMPGMDGLEALRVIMNEYPRPVVMLSAGGPDGAAATLRALELGAVDFVRKPSGPISLDLGRVREHLFDALHAASSAQPSSSVAARVAAAPLPIVEPRASSTTRKRSVARGVASIVPPRWVVCIASSTGGPAALTRIVPALQMHEGVAYIVVQHLPETFTRSLAHRLDQLSRIPVVEVQDTMALSGGHIYIAQGGRHVKVADKPRLHFVLDDGAPIWGVRPAADPLFESVAGLFGASVMGVVLTGMGRDGAEGLKVIRDHGGIGIVQDRESSVVPGMPVAAREHAGCEHVVSLDLVAATVEHALEQLKGEVQ